MYFRHCVTEAADETEVNNTYLDEAPSRGGEKIYDDNPVQLARLRAAWLVAHRAKKRIDAARARSDKDDRPSRTSAPRGGSSIHTPPSASSSS